MCALGLLGVHVFINLLFPTFASYPTAPSNSSLLDNITISFSWEEKKHRWRKVRNLNLNICVEEEANQEIALYIVFYLGTKTSLFLKKCKCG